MLIPFGDDVERTRIPKGVISLIIINVLVAAWEFRLVQDYEAHPECFDDFMMTFGLVPKDVAAGSVIGWFTYMFLHGGLMHLFGNMLVLWAFGPTLEEFLGTTRFLFMYAMFWMYSQWSGFLSTSSDANEGGVAFGCHIGGFFGGMLLYPFFKTTSRRLVDHGFGEKRIEDELEAAHAKIDPRIAATGVALVQKCSDCGSDLLDSHQIAPDLYRCPKSGCGRLNLSASVLQVLPQNRLAVSR